MRISFFGFSLVVFFSMITSISSFKSSNTSEEILKYSESFIISSAHIFLSPFSIFEMVTRSTPNTSAKLD